MNKKQQLINLFFEANDKAIEDDALLKIRKEDNHPKELYQQYRESIGKVLKYCIIQRV